MREVKLKKIFKMAICVCLLIGAVLILGFSFFTTIYYKMNEENDKPFYGFENIPLLVLFMGLILFGFYLLKKKGVLANYKKFAACGLIFCLAYCLLLIFSIRPLPVNDSELLDGVINNFVKGDYSKLTNKGGYLFIWPFQLGYVFFGEMMTSFFGAGNYLAWDLVQLVSVFFTMFLLNKICMECFDDSEICGIMSLLSMGALFFYNYVQICCDYNIFFFLPGFTSTD